MSKPKREAISKAEVKSGPKKAKSASSQDPSNKFYGALVAAQAAIDKKAENLRILDVSELTSFTDAFVVCSALSDRQVQAIADGVSRSMKNKKIRLLSSEGYQEARWVLLDFGEVVVHIFLDAIRDYYEIESLWSEAKKVEIPAEFYGPAGSGTVN